MLTSKATFKNGRVNSGTIIWSSGTMGANAVLFSIDMKGLAFSIGLTLAITGANANATIIYE